MLAQNLNDEHYELTRNTIDSFGLTDGIERCELIIIDNASAIGGDQMSTVADIYVRNKKNQGYPASINQGVALASGELVCLANNDIRVSPNWLTVAEEIFSKLPNTASVHYKMLGYNEPFNLSDKVWETGKERWCHGSFFVCKKDVFNEVGKYEVSYREGGMDDWDFQHRLRHIHKYNTAYTNGAAFQHKDSSTYNAHDQQKRAERDARNELIFEKKFGRKAVDIWNDMYPNQMSIPWKPFP